MEFLTKDIMIKASQVLSHRRLWSVVTAFLIFTLPKAGIDTSFVPEALIDLLQKFGEALGYLIIAILNISSLVFPKK